MERKNPKLRIRLVQEQKQTLRSVIVLTSSTVVLLSFFLLVFINLKNNQSALAALPNSGDYRSAGSGNWNNAAVWQKYNGSSWVNASSSPDSEDRVIRIMKGHSVTVSSDISVDQLIIAKGGFLIINENVTINIVDGKGIDLEITGVLKNAGIVSAAGASIVVDEGGKYQHNYTTTSGTIPDAVWISGSTCEIIGYTTNVNTPSGLQAFSNFIWNCPGQQMDINLDGGIKNIKGDLIIESTGTKSLNWANGPISTSVSGNVVVSGGEFILNKSAGITTLNVEGDFSQSGGSFALSDKNGAKSTFNLLGNFILSNGKCDFEKGDDAECTINVSGNMTHTGGMIEAPSYVSASVRFVFNKSGVQLINSNKGIVKGNIDYTVNKGSVLDLGNSIIHGRNFTLLPEAGIVIKSSEGICSSGTAGSIQVSGNRLFSSSADYIYNGTIPQQTGSGLPATVRNLEISNTGNVSLTNSISVYGSLIFSAGNIVTGENEINIINTSSAGIAGYSSSSYIIGNLRRSVSGTGSYDFPIGTANNYEFLNINLSGTTGVSSIISKFNNRDASFLSSPIVASSNAEISVNKILNYGFWTLIPNSKMLSGTYTLTVTERGHENIVSGSSFALISRNAGSGNWESNGSQSMNIQPENGTAITVSCSGLKSFGEFAIGYDKLLNFDKNSLIQGKEGKEESIYKFKNINSNVDAWIRLIDIDGGASLVNIDAESAGLSEGWQPLLKIPAASTASIKWEIRLKVAGTSIDTVLPEIGLTAFNISSNPLMKEFVKSLNLKKYSMNGESIFQVNYKNVNSILYETGMTNNSDKPGLMQPKLYFKTFFSCVQPPPLKLALINSKRNADLAEFN